MVRGWGGGGGWTASGRATKEKIQRKSDPHGAQSDKNTLKPGNKGSSYEEARTNGPIKRDHGLNGTTPPPPPFVPYTGGTRANPTPRGEGHAQTPLPLVKGAGVGGYARGGARTMGVGECVLTCDKRG